MLHIFTMSAGLLGVCLTAIGLIRVVVTRSNVQTFGDDLLAVDSFLFMLTCFLSFWSIRTGRTKIRRLLRHIVDWLFMFGLILMVVVCMLIAWSIF